MVCFKQERTSTPVTMQPLLGLFFFSVLLATGFALECETCAGLGNSCTGPKQNCTDGLDTCLTLVVKAKAGGQTATSIAKRCYSTEACALLKPGKTITEAGVSTTIKSVKCKAPSPSASLLLALSGLLLLKVFF